MMARFSDHLAAMGVAWPSNLWADTSITTTATLGRIADLARVGGPATGRFLSVEPQHEAIDFGDRLSGVDWVIQGGASRDKDHRFELTWARSVRDACRAAGRPYFLKQLGTYAFENGRRLRLSDDHGGVWGDWPEELRIREVPNFVSWVPIPAGEAEGDTPLSLPVLA